MSRITKLTAFGSTAIITSLLTAGLAHAQIDEITVTAQKREQTLQQTPVSVAVVTDTQIEQSQIRDAADLQTLVPSLRVAEFASSTNTEFSLRGIGTSSFNPGLEPSVGVFVDGVYRPRTGASINDFLSVERIEVLRGPQSTLFGRNTPAGLISIITKEPEFEFGAAGELTIGNYQDRIVKGTVTGPLMGDKVAGRLDASYHTNDGYLEDVTTGRDLNDRDRENYRGQLLILPDENTRIRLIADYGNIDENCCAAPFAYYDPIDRAAIIGLGGTALPADPFDGKIAVDGKVHTDLETSGISGQVDHDFDAFTVTSITAFRHYDEDQDFDADFSDLDLVSSRAIDNAYDSFTQELRVTSTGDNFIDWMFGGFYYKNKLDYANSTPYGADGRAFFNAASAPQVAPIVAGLGLPPGTGGISLLEIFLNSNNATGVGNFVPLASGNAALPVVPAEGYIDTTHGLIRESYDYDTESISAFGSLDFNITDRFTLTVGARYAQEDKDLKADINNPDPISAFSFVDLAQDLRLVSPTTCDPTLFTVVGGDACAYLVPALLAGAGLPFDPTVPLTREQAMNPQINQLLGFTAFQNWPPVNAAQFPSKRSDDNFAYNVIASYDVTPTLNVYASYATGFKPGGFNVSVDAAKTGIFEFEDEKAESFEAGAKGSLMGSRLVYSFAAFYQEIDDFQSNNFVGNGFALDNAGSIEVGGVEFEGQFAPTDRLYFTGGFTWLFHNEYGEYKYAPCPDSFDPSDADFQLCLPGNQRTNDAGITALFNDLSGVERGNSDFVGAMTGTYTQPLGDTLEGFVRGEVTYTSEFAHSTSLDKRPFANQDDFALFNASVGIGADDGAWQLQFWGRNIFDEEYTKGGFPSVGYLGTSYNVYPGDPATYGVTLRVRH